LAVNEMSFVISVALASLTHLQQINFDLI